MQIVIDLDTRKPQRSLTDSRTATQFDFKRGDDAVLEILFVRAGVQTQLTVGIAITFGVKLRGRYDSTPLVQTNDFALSGSGATAKYIGYPSFNTAELNEAFGIDDSETNDVAVLDLMGEISWTEPTTEILTSSETFSVRVNNDVNREDDAPPNALPSPSDWLDARAVRFDKSQTLTDAQKQSARANIDAMPEPIIRDTAPVDSTMRLSGDLTDGTYSTASIDFVFETYSGGRPLYSAGDATAISWNVSENAWFIIIEGIAWYSTADVATPDLVPTGAWHATTNPNAWQPLSPATGTPVVTDVATAAQAVGQLVRVGAAAPYTWHRVQTLSPNTFAPTTPTIAEITGLTDALAAKQPLDSDLTAYANAADAAARRALLALAPDTTGNTNLNAILAAGPAASRDALGAESIITGGFYEDFSRYANGTLIPNDGTFMPMVGNAWRISYNLAIAGATPIVQNGAFGDKTSKLWYVGSSVASKRGKFSMGAELGFLPTDSPAGINHWSVNMSFSAQEMITAPSFGILPAGVMHVNINATGVTGISYFPANFSSDAATDTVTAVSHDATTGTKLFFSGTALPTGVTTSMWCIRIDDNNFKLASSYENAVAGVAVDIGSVTLGSDAKFAINDITCLNRTSTTAGHPFVPGAAGLTLAALQCLTLLFEVEGEYLTITRSGVGSIIYHSPSLTRKIRDTTYFWWEGNGDTDGTTNTYATIRKAWANAPSANELLVEKEADPVYINSVTINQSFSQPGIPGRFRVGNIRLNGAQPSGNAKLSVGGSSTKTLNGILVATGGNVFAEGGYLRNVGGTAIGENISASAVMGVSSNITSSVFTNTTGADVLLRAFTHLKALETEERQISTILGNLAAGTKRIIIKTPHYTAFDSGNITHTGAYKIVLTRKGSAWVFVEFYANNQLVSLTRVAQAFSWYEYEFRVTQDAAGQVVINDIQTMVDKSTISSD